ncbi:MAG: translation initiation factor IF-6 [Candidatus Micrarchaeota archaeon]|nr:translation initiation factor IF-6 [Candidatus Micrarchaeota archaeon]
MIFRHKSIEHVGLYAKATDKYVLAGLISSSHFYSLLSKICSKTVKIDVFGSPAITFFCAMNSHGVILPYFTENYVVERIKAELDNKINIVLYDGQFTALGNLISVNDKICLASRIFDKANLKLIADSLNVEVVQIDLGNFVTPGSLILLTNKGFCLSPLIKDKYDEVKELTGLSGEIVTCNTGSPYLHIGVIANSTGAIVGHNTTGFEMGRIEMALDLVDQK